MQAVVIILLSLSGISVLCAVGILIYNLVSHNGKGYRTVGIVYSIGALLMLVASVLEVILA